MKHNKKWIVVEICTLLAIVGVAASISVNHAEGLPSAPPANANNAHAPNADLPLTISLPAIIRDFRGGGANGHPDFQTFTGSRATVELVEENLGEDGKPVLRNDGVGKHIGNEWRDSAGRNIRPADFASGRGDIAGSYSNENNRQISSAGSFASWYNDTNGVNTSKIVDMVLNLVPESNRYVFDSANDQPWRDREGFFPINGELFGNFENWNKNFHFTTQLEADFIYRAEQGQVFTFSGDDDVWVFIDGKLVIDLGGLHPRCVQTVELDRLDWLENGRQYRFKIFHAERRTNQSNFRMETTIQFSPVQPPSISNQFD